MNTNTTISTNNTNNTNKRNITGLLNPVGDDFLPAISAVSLSKLEVVATSDDTFPPLKVAVIEALAIIEIVKVCVLTSAIPSQLSMRQHQKFKTNKKNWTAFSESLVEKIVQAACQYNESEVQLNLQPILKI